MSDWNRVGLIFLIGMFMSIGLFMNPGYFSHDEIGWGIKAISEKSLSDINYYNIFHYNEFHYRPLNFNLWLLTSYYLFEFPQLYHLFLVLFGLVNSTLIYFFLKQEVESRLAFLTAITSTIMPTVAFVNGWIGTIADVFWFMCCIIALILHQKNRKLSHERKTISMLLSLLFFIFSLMFKETAVAFPGVLFVYVLYKNFQERGDFKIYKNISDVIIFISSTLIVFSYVFVRFDFLFPSDGGGYGTSIANIPIRAFEYFVYPFLIKNIEIHGLFSQSTASELITALFLHLVFVVVLCGKNWFRYFLYFSCYFVTSVPILILDMSLPHYIYASGFVTAFGISILFYQNSYKRILGIILFVILAIHGVNVQKNYIVTGMYQNNFVNTLYSILKNNNKQCTYVITPEVGSASWIAIRAIAFREYVDDIKIVNKVYFDGDASSKSIEGIKCGLSLDTKGRVFFIGVNHGVQ